MAGKIIYPYYQTGEDLYVRIRRPADGFVWNVSGASAGTWEAFNVSDIAEHALAMVETPAGSYEYEAEFPSGIEAGVFLVETRLQAGGNPAGADRVLSTGVMHWDGSAEIVRNTPEANDTLLSTNHGAGSWEDAGGGGATPKTYTVTDSGSDPIEGVFIRVTTAADGSGLIAQGLTNTSGEFTFFHDLASATTVYIWRAKSGLNFTDPDTEIIP